MYTTSRWPFPSVTGITSPRKIILGTQAVTERPRSELNMAIYFDGYCFNPAYNLICGANPQENRDTASINLYFCIMYLFILCVMYLFRLFITLLIKTFYYITYYYNNKRRFKMYVPLYN